MTSGLCAVEHLLGMVEPFVSWEGARVDGDAWETIAITRTDESCCIVGNLGWDDTDWNVPSCACRLLWDLLPFPTCRHIHGVSGGHLTRSYQIKRPLDRNDTAIDQCGRYDDPRKISPNVINPKIVGFWTGVFHAMHVQREQLRCVSDGILTLRQQHRSLVLLRKFRGDDLTRTHHSRVI